MDLKTVVFMALAIAASTFVVYAGGRTTPFVTTNGNVYIFNLLGDPITAECFDFDGKNFPAGTRTIAPNDNLSWRFEGADASGNRAEVCHIQWVDSSDCASGSCRVHKKDVRVWSHDQFPGVPGCVNCVWRVVQDGFYRRNADVAPADWHFVFGWN